MLKPLTDKVIIEVVKEQKTTSGIILAENAQKKSQIGKVIAVGPGAKDDNGKLIPTTIKEGQHIVFQQYAGTEVEYHGVNYLVIREDDILAVLE